MAKTKKLSGLIKHIETQRATAVLVRIVDVGPKGREQLVGTSCAVTIGPSPSEYFVATNKHVTRRVVDHKKRRMKLTLLGPAGGKYVETAEVAYTHKVLDLAMLSVSSWRRRSRPTTVRFVPFSMFAEPKEIVEGQEIFFLGYPLGLGIHRAYPVVRKGMIAQTPRRSPLFVIDGDVNQGDSGCPVFSAATGHFLGIATGFRPAYIDVGDPRSGFLRLPYNSGLGVVIKATAIRRQFPRATRALRP